MTIDYTGISLKLFKAFIKQTLRQVARESEIYNYARADWVVTTGYIDLDLLFLFISLRLPFDNIHLIQFNGWYTQYYESIYVNKYVNIIKTFIHLILVFKKSLDLIQKLLIESTWSLRVAAALQIVFTYKFAQL